MPTERVGICVGSRQSSVRKLSESSWPPKMAFMAARQLPHARLLVRFPARFVRSSPAATFRWQAEIPSVLRQAALRRCGSLGSQVAQGGGVKVNWSVWRAGGWTPSEETWPETPLAQYWSSLPEEPLVVEDFFGRQAIYHRLITIDSLRTLFPGPQLKGCPTRHFLWAYAVQLDWQWRSGRLGEGRAISPDSWWGCVNYTLSVLPYLAAMQVGLVEEIQLPPPPAELDVAMVSWTKFWQDLKLTAEHQEGVPLTERQLDQVQQQLWLCHTDSIHAALKVYQDQLLKMPQEEQQFGSGWARFVEVMAAVSWRTDLQAMAQNGAGYLPLTRLSSEADGSAGARPSEVELVKAGVKTVQQVASLSEGNLRLMVSFFRRVGRNFARRVVIPEVILTLTRPNQGKLRPFLRLLWWYIWPRQRD